MHIIGFQEGGIRVNSEGCREFDASYRFLMQLF